MKTLEDLGTSLSAVHWARKGGTITRRNRKHLHEQKRKCFKDVAAWRSKYPDLELTQLTQRRGVRWPLGFIMHMLWNNVDTLTALAEQIGPRTKGEGVLDCSTLNERGWPQKWNYPIRIRYRFNRTWVNNFPVLEIEAMAVEPIELEM